MPYYCFKIYCLEYDYGGNVDHGSVTLPVLSLICDTETEATEWRRTWESKTEKDWDMYAVVPDEYVISEDYTDYCDISDVSTRYYGRRR